MHENYGLNNMKGVLSKLEKIMVKSIETTIYGNRSTFKKNC